jgi:glucose-1-phosphate adenylyltransferase
MDYRGLLNSHVASGADVTIVTADHSQEFFKRASENAGTGLADMGIYVFNYETLRTAAQREGARVIDIAADLIPRLIGSCNVNTYRVEDQASRMPLYWRDINTPEDYYSSSMDLLARHSCIDPYDREWPIRSADPIRLDQADALSAIGREPEVNSVIPSSVSIRKACVYHSVLFPGVVLESAAYVRNSVLLPGAVIGAGAAVRCAIVDPNVVIDAGDRIGYNREEDRRRFRVMANGVVVVSSDDVSSPFGSDLDFMRRREKVYERRSEVTVFARTSELFRKRTQRVD